MIPIQAEPEDLQEDFKIYEKCVFCNNSTNMWHVKTNNPVCSFCAKEHKVGELHNWITGKKPSLERSYLIS